MGNSNQMTSDAAISSQSNQQEKSNYKYSGLVARIIASIIDTLIILAISIPLALVFQSFSGKSPTVSQQSFTSFLTVAVSSIFNVALLFWNNGATVGKMAMKLRVVNLSYEKLSFRQIILRETVGKLLSTILFDLGYIWVAIDEKKQGWHDKLAKTYVVHSQPIIYEEYVENQKSKRSHLPLVLIILGVLESIQPLIIAFTVMPQLSKLYGNLNATGYSPMMSYRLVGMIALVALAQIVYGVVLMTKQKSSGSLLEAQKKYAKILLVIGVTAAVISIPIMIISVIGPLYSLTNSIK